MLGQAEWPGCANITHFILSVFQLVKKSYTARALYALHPGKPKTVKGFRPG